MKTSVIIICLISFFFVANKSFSQSEAAVPFLTFPISPSQNAMGYTGTSLPIDEPYGFLLNPAQLGYTSQKNNFSFMFYPSKVKLWGDDNFQIKGSAFNLGYNFNSIIGIPLSVGFGYANPEIILNYSDIFVSPSDIFVSPIQVEEINKFETYSFGAGINYYIQFSAGISFKNITSKLPNFSLVIPPNSYKANASAVDFGFLVNVPVLKLINNNLSFEILDKKPMKPFFDISLGYSQLNIGDEIYYVDPSQSDPLPRTARLGYGISTGVYIQIDDRHLRFVGFDFTIDAEDLLLKYESDINSFVQFDGYQSFIGDINVGRNILQVKGDDNVITHAGVQFNFLESFLLKFGQMKGKSPYNRSTNGFEIRSAGVLTFLSSVTDNTIVKFLSNHFDLRYYNSNYIVAAGLETNIKGFAIYFQNLNSLF